MKTTLPKDVQFRILDDKAKNVQGQLDNVKHTILEGAMLTMVIVFFFLHSWRSTIITGLTLPISVLASFIAMKYFGFTLNFLTLMALSLCIGLLIDDAIVVRENIVRHLGMGKNHVRAAEDGTNEIGVAVMATTFAIVAVFVPIAFMKGIIGRFFLQFGITVAVAVLVSLFVSFTLDPMLSSVWPDPVKDRFKYVPWLGRLMARIEHGIEWLHDVYAKVLALALDWRKSTLLLAVVLFAASLMLVPKIGGEFVPQVDDGYIHLRLKTPIGSSLEYSDAKLRQAEAALAEFKEIESVSTIVGSWEGRNYSEVHLKLTNVHETHRRSQQEMEKGIAQHVQQVAQRGFFLAEVGVADVELGVQVGFGEAVEGRIEFRDRRTFLALQRVQVGPARAEVAVSGDQLGHGDALAAELSVRRRGHGADRALLGAFGERSDHGRVIHVRLGGTVDGGHVLHRVEIGTPVVGHGARIVQVRFVQLFHVRRITAEQVRVGVILLHHSCSPFFAFREYGAG
ncbi:hypothetical protein GCM10025794_11140 [Massilia kyonggiensis]